MSRTLVTGATGRLGRALCPRLTAAGHTVRAASRDPPRNGDDIEWVALDLTDDGNIEAALDDIDIVIHAATAPQGDTEAVDVEGTRRLLNATETSSVEHVLYPSIVGVDEIPFAYYEHKAAAERVLENSTVPTTIVRATQFHSFVADLLDSIAKLPLWPLPTSIPIQPVASEEVADALVERTTQTASGYSDPIGGPEVHTVGELARTYRSARGLHRPIVRVPIPGRTASAFRAGHATCPDHSVGTVTWEEWLSARTADDSDTSSV